MAAEHSLRCAANFRTLSLFNLLSFVEVVVMCVACPCSLFNAALLLLFPALFFFFAILQMDIN